ncbi:MAG: hypothetical protein ABF515_10155, partial [Bifidobacterium sp.]
AHDGTPSWSMTVVQRLAKMEKNLCHLSFREERPMERLQRLPALLLALQANRRITASEFTEHGSSNIGPDCEWENPESA